MGGLEVKGRCSEATNRPWFLLGAVMGVAALYLWASVAEPPPWAPTCLFKSAWTGKTCTRRSKRVKACICFIIFVSFLLGKLGSDLKVSWHHKRGTFIFSWVSFMQMGTKPLMANWFCDRGRVFFLALPVAETPLQTQTGCFYGSHTNLYHLNSLSKRTHPILSAHLIYLI